MYGLKQIVNYFCLTLALIAGYTVGKASTPDIIPYDYIVLLEDKQALEAFINSNFNGYYLKLNKHLGPNSSFYRINALNPQISSNQVLNRIKDHPSVALAQHNSRVTLRSENAIIPNDEFFELQWHLTNNGDTNDSANDADVDADNAWALSTGGVTVNGDTIVVAIIDNGFDLEHQDLNYFVNHGDPNNGIDDDNNGYIDDYLGWNIFNNSDFIPSNDHGTHVCGIAAAKGNNEMGVSGINWNLKILPVVGSSETQSEVVEAYLYVASLRKRYNETNGDKGAFIVASNTSFGVNYGTQSEFPIWCAMYDTLGQLGILSIAATVNNNINIDIVDDIPTGCDSEYLITVTNTTKLDDLNTNAGYGLNTIDLGAPGTNIWSTIPNNSYSASGWTGTSLSCPQVSGAVALVYSTLCSTWLNDYKQNPSLRVKDIKDAIVQGAEIIPALKNKSVGEGRLNVINSIKRANDIYCSDCIKLDIIETKSTCGLNNGQILLDIKAIAIPYTIIWSNGVTGVPVISNLSPNAYSFVIIDALGCTFEGSTVIEASPQLIVVTSASTPSSSTATDGQLTAELSQGVGPYTIEWVGPVTGNSPVLNNVVYGNYSLFTTDGWGCETVINISLGTVGINDAAVENIKLYPNPVADILYFDVEEHNHDVVEVYNLEGKLIHHHYGVKQIEVSNWNEGLYTVILKRENNYKTGKVLVQH